MQKNITHISLLSSIISLDVLYFDINTKVLSKTKENIDNLNITLFSNENYYNVQLVFFTLMSLMLIVFFYIVFSLLLDPKSRQIPAPAELKTETEIGHKEKEKSTKPLPDVRGLRRDNKIYGFIENRNHDRAKLLNALFGVPASECIYIQVGARMKAAVPLNISEDKIVSGRYPTIWVPVNSPWCGQVTSGFRFIPLNQRGEGLLKLTDRKPIEKKN